MSEQNFEFDKFMSDIVEREDEKREKIREYVDTHQDSPARKLNKLYRERWQNRIRWGQR